MKGIAWAALVLFLSSAAWAQRAEPLPQELEGVGIEEKPGAQVPLEAVFADEQGHPVALGQFFDRKRPVIVALVYYRCPMLCGLVLQGLVEGLKGLSWTAGQEFEVVTLSIDPLETPTLAKLKRQTYLSEYGRPGAQWHFLTGKQEAIGRVAEALGFRYRWNEERGEWVHAAGIFVLTPDGKVARTLYGVLYEPQTLKYALMEARQGHLSSLGEQILMFCFHYDPQERRYVLAATRLMRVTGLLTAFGLGLWLALVWRRQREEK